LAKASRNKRTKRSAVKRRSNPSTGAILAFVALGAAAAGGAWWFFSKKGGDRSVTRDTRSLRPAPISIASALSQPFRLNQNRAAASEAPAKGAGGVMGPNGAPGVGGVAPVETA
jgi:flagellar basal body-associated protein FliL